MTNDDINTNHIQRILKVKAMYDELGTLEAVGNKLGLTRERVRQILMSGQRKKLFLYKTTSQTNIEYNLMKISKQYLINILCEEYNTKIICEKLGINQFNYFRLLKTYKIDRSKYAQLVKKNRCLSQYTKIVNTLNHHPSTSELNSNPIWRALWVRIDRYWGGIDFFRKTHGIEIINTCYYSNAQKAQRISRVQRKEDMNLKIEQVLNYIRYHKLTTANEISQSLNIKYGSIGSYLNYLHNNKSIIKIKTGRNVEYSTTPI